MESRLKDLIPEAGILLDHAADAISILDETGCRVYQNRACQNMLRRKNSEPMGEERDIVLENRVIGRIVTYHDMSEVNRLKQELERLNQKLRTVQTKYSFKDIIGKDPALQQVISKAKIVAATPATIMIRGESGTGKEIFANAIHNSSPRRHEKFVKLNCSSLPEELLESELFGYREGAFTGARKGGKKGMFEEADRGTLFLDEIGDVSPAMQVKLLRVLQEKEIMPVGSTETVPVDVRIICATHKPLEEMIRQGAFREDLYYRLNVFPLFIPPLRDRKDDIADIARYLLNRYDEFYDRQVTALADDAADFLRERQWKGNVRELENVLIRAVINLDREETVLRKEDILNALGGDAKSSAESREPAAENGAFGQRDDGEGLERLPDNLQEAMETAEAFCIRRALAASDGDKNKAAVRLGIPLRTLYYKCKKLQI